MKRYSNAINFNWNKSELKDGAGAIKLILHAIDNTKRTNEPELINKNPELKNEELIKTDLNKIKKEMKEAKENLKKGGKGAKPYRFLVTTLNVEPTKENKPIIDEWKKEMLKLFSKYFNIEGAFLHLNETSPHLHIIAKNFNEKQWGNFVNGKKVETSGDKGRVNLDAIWKEGKEINQKLAKKYNLQFIQEPVTKKGDNRKVKQFRQKLGSEDMSQDDINKIVKWLESKHLAYSRKHVLVAREKWIKQAKQTQAPVLGASSERLLEIGRWAYAEAEKRGIDKSRIIEGLNELLNPVIEETQEKALDFDLEQQKKQVRGRGRGSI